jgi:NADH:ubiquinone reductase (non-electrogenic)
MPADKRETLLILGTGFAAFSAVRGVDIDRYQIVVVAPRNHFLFTPLLPSTTVGTIEFRSIIEPIRTARKGLRFHQAYCTRLDTENRIAYCEGKFKSTPFEVKYDRAIVAVGAVSNTFGIPGVAEHCHFLKEIQDARNIRHEVIQCFERASKPNRPVEDFDWLLRFVIVGGGPTGVEFAAELHDFVEQDLAKWFPDLIPYVRITLLEAQDNILTMFDASLSDYTRNHFARNKIQVRTNSMVKEVRSGVVVLQGGEEIGYGLAVWSTGNGPTPLVAGLDVPKDRAQRLLTDACFRVAGRDDLFAVGDCAVIDGNPLPPTAQAAQQAGTHLARVLNSMAKGAEPAPFEYKHQGMLAYIGGKKALADLGSVQGKGFSAWLFWRSAYLTKLVSLQNKFLVASDWARSFLFGRDISQY